MKKINKYDLVILVGDIHGDWDNLFKKIKYNKISNATLVCVGDVGIGFCMSHNTEMNQIYTLDDKFKALNIEFIGIRGNHCDPAYYQGNINLSNFKLLPDYTYGLLAGNTALFVGGAISVDVWRRTAGIDYWYHEGVDLNMRKVKPCEVLITHTTGSLYDPIPDKSNISWHIDACKKMGYDLLADLEKEKQKMNKIIKKADPTRHYFGHFHISAISHSEKCDARCLDILEFFELKKIN